MPASRVTLMALAATALAGAAQAQAPVAQPAPAALEQLVVTAQRRAEPQQAVPTSVAAYTGAQLTELSVQTLPEVARVTPGVQFINKKGAGLPSFVIRGVGLLDYNANNAPAAAVFFDDIYQPSNAMVGVALFDIDRVEVLKGPQGGLWGRNTSGGAVQLVTRRPEPGGSNGYLTAGFGSWQRWNIEGATDIPLSDKLGVRISGLHDDGNGGWQYSATDNRRWGAPNRTAGRLQIRFRPDERFDANLKLESSWDGSETPLARSVPIYTRTGDFCAAALAGRRDDLNCFTLAQVTRAQLRRPAAPSAAIQSPDGSTTLSRAFNDLHNRNQSATLSAAYHLDGADLTSITGLGRFRYGQNYDFAASPDRLGLQSDRSTIDTWSQELRLASTGDAALSWLVGAVYSEEDFDDARSVDIRDNFFLQQALGIPSVVASRAILQLGYDQHTRYGAVYGEAGYRLSDTVRVKGTLRYSDETKRYENGSVAVSAPLIVQLSGLKSRYELDDHLSGKATIDWTPQPGLMAYASASRGYKSGGFYGGFAQVAGQVQPYGEETVWAYEAGVKAQALEGRLQADAAVFHYDYHDVQGFTNVLLPAAPGSSTRIALPLLTNLGEADHDGVELNAAWLAAPGLTLRGGVAWLDAKYVDTDVKTVSAEGIAVPLEGRRRGYAPEWSGFLSARYEAALSGAITAAGQVDYNFRSRQTSPVSPVDRAVGGIDAYDLANARLTFTARPQALSLSLWVKNLANNRYRVDAGSDGLLSYTETYGEPRSWGVELSKRW